MNEEYLLGAYNSFGGQEKLKVDFNTWVSKIKENDNYKQGMFNSFGGQEKLGASYDDWNSKVFGLNKEEETTIEEDEGVISGEELLGKPNPNLEKFNPQTNNKVSKEDEDAVFSYIQNQEDEYKEQEKSLKDIIRYPELANEKALLEQKLKTRPLMQDNSDITNRISEIDSIIKAPKKSFRKGLKEKQIKIDSKIQELEQKDYQLGANGNFINTSGTYQDLKKQKEIVKESIKNENKLLKKLTTDRTIGEDFRDATINVLTYGLIPKKYIKQLTSDNETIKLNEKVEEELLIKLEENPKTKQKLLYGGDDRNLLSLNEKENLIKEAKIKVFKQEKEDIESSLSELNNKYLTTDNVTEKQEIKKEYDYLVQKSYNLAGTYNIDIAKGQIKNIFKKTTEKEEYREKLKDQKTLDVGSTFLNGFGNIIGDYLTSGASLVAGLGDATFSDKNYGVFDALGDTAYQLSDLNLLPSSEQESGRLFNDDYEFTPSAYSIGKAFSNTAPFSIALIMDLKGGDAKGVYSKLGKYISPKNLDKANELSKSINMAKRAYQITLTDNLSEAKELGLDGGKAFVYQQAVSTITGAVSLINPDFKFFNTSAGKIALQNFSGSLKSAVNKKAIIKTTQNFIKDIAKEVGEEELEFALTEITSIGLVEGYQSKFKDVQHHKDLIANTIAGTGVFAGVGLRSNYKKTKIDFYKELTDNFDPINTQIDDLLKIATDEKILKALNESKELIGNVSEAINKSPKNVTSNQIDLLIEKKKLINKMKSMDDSFHPKYKEQIEVINEKIKKDLKPKKEGSKDIKESTVTELTRDFTDGLGESQDISDVANGVSKVMVDGAEVQIKSDGDKIVLDKIRVDEKDRGNKVAEKALNKIVDLADEKGLDITLNVLPEDNTVDKQRLISLYEKAGFKLLDGDKMERVAKVKETVEEVNEDFDLSVIKDVIEGESKETTKKETKPKVEATTPKTEVTEDNIPKEVLDAKVTVNALGQSLSDATDSQRKEYNDALKTIKDNGYEISVGKLSKIKSQSNKETQQEQVVEDNEVIDEDDSANKITETIDGVRESLRKRKLVDKKSAKEPIKIRTNRNEYTVSLVDGKLDIKPRVGKVVSDGERRKVTKLYAESIDYGSGRVANFQGMDNATPNQKTERVIEDSENPQEIVSEIRKVREQQTDESNATETSKEDAIYQVLSNNALNDDAKRQVTDLGSYYTNVGFRDNKKKIGIDKAREMAESISGQDISMDEMLSFLESYQNLRDYKESVQTQSKEQELDLKERFKQVTGVELTESLMDEIIPETEINTDEDLDINFESDPDLDVPFQTQSNIAKRLAGIAMTNLVDQLNLTGLAKAVYVWSNNEINSFLEKLGINSVQKQGLDYQENLDRWVGDREIVESGNIQDLRTGEPVVVKVYHGTTNEFYEFDADVKGNIEGHLGRVNYFTSDEYDANQNYQSDGPDLTGRIEREVEILEQQFEDKPSELYQKPSDFLKYFNVNVTQKEIDDSYGDERAVAELIASKKLKGNTDKVLEVYVRMDNPVVLGNRNWVEAIPKELYEDSIEDATQEIADENGITIEEAQEDYQWDIEQRAMEIEGVENPLIEALQDALNDNGYQDSNAVEILDDIGYESEIDLDALEDKVRKGELYENYDGEMASSQVISDMFQNLGYDGIVLTDVSERFRNMGLSSNTSHVHIFNDNANNIKLADGTNTTFNENTKDIRFQQGTVEIERIVEEAKGNNTYMKAPNGNDSNLTESQWVMVRTNNFKNWFGDWQNNPEDASKVLDENGEPLVVYHGGDNTITTFDEDYGGQTTANNDYGAFYFSNEYDVAEDYSRQAIIRRYEGRDSDELRDYYEELSEEDILFIEENSLEEFAETKLKVVSTFLNMRNPLEDNSYNGGMLDIQKTQRQVGFVKEGRDDNFEFSDEYMYEPYDESDIESFREEIEDRARENNGLEEDESIEDYMFEEATREIFEENGYEQEVKEFDGVVIRDVVDNIGDASNLIQDEFIVIDPNQIKSATENDGSFSNYNNDIRFQKELSEEGVHSMKRPLLQQDNGSQNNSENVYGFVYNDEVYINRDKARLDTPIHEFGHLWINHIKSKHKDVYDRGLALIEGTEYHTDVKNNPSYKGLSKKAQLEEALAQAIGEKGVKILEQTKLKQFQVWFRNVFRKIAQGFGLTNMSPEQIANITLDKFTTYASAELLSGNKIVDRKQKKSNRKDKDVTNIDVVMESEKARVKALTDLKKKIEEKRGVEEDVKKEVQDYVLQSIENSALIGFIKKNELSKILTLVRKGKTFNNLEKAIESIDELMPKLEERLKDYKDNIQKTKEDLKQKAEAQKTLTEDLRREVIKFINAQIDGRNINDIKKREINSLMTIVKNTKSITSFTNALYKVDEIFVKVENKVLFKNINKLLGRKLSKKVYGRIKANLVSEDAETILNEVKSLFKKIKKTRRENYIVLNSYLTRQESILSKELDPKQEVTEQEYLELEGIDASIKILNAVLSESHETANVLLNEALTQITDVYDNGRSELKALREAQKEYLDKKIEEYRKDAGSNKSENSLKTTQDLDKEAKRTINKIQRGIFDFTSGWVSGSLDSLMTIISKSKQTDRDSSPLVDLVNRMKRKERFKKSRINNFSDFLISKQKELFGSQRKAEIAFKKRRKVTVRRRPDNSDRNTPLLEIEVTHTDAELLNLWMNYKNQDLRPALELNGYDEQFFEELELSREMKRYGMFLYDFYETMHKQSDEIYKKMYFHSMGKVNYYAGKVSRRGDASPQADLSPDGNNFSVHTTGFGSQKERTSNAPIVAMDANKLAFRAIAETSHFIAYAEIHKEYAKLLGDEAFNKAVKFNNPKYGDKIVKALNFYKTNDLEKGGVQKGYMFLDFIGRNIIRSTLAGKIKVGVTQTISFFNGASDLPPKLEKNFFEYYNPKSISKGFKELAEVSQFLKNRYDQGGLENAVSGLTDIANDGLFPDFADIEANRKAMARFMDKTLQKLMLNVKVGDKIGVAGAVPVYLAWKDVYRKQGLTESEAKVKALLKFESSADRSQQTNSTFGKSEFQKHPILRYFAMYATSPIQNMQNANYHWRELFRNLSKEKNGKSSNMRNIVGILNYQFAQPMAYVYLSQLFAGSILSVLGFGDEEPDDADKTLANSFILSNYGSIPMLGGIITGIVDYASDKEFTFGGLVSSALLKSITELESDFKTLERTNNPETATKYKKRIGKKLGGMLLSIPDIFMSGALDFEEIYWNDDVDGMVKVWKALGYSNYAIEQSRKRRMTRAEAEQKRLQKEMDYKKKKNKPKKKKVNELFLKGGNQR